MRIEVQPQQKSASYCSGDIIKLTTGKFVRIRYIIAFEKYCITNLVGWDIDKEHIFDSIDDVRKYLEAIGIEEVIHYFDIDSIKIVMR